MILLTILLSGVVLVLLGSVLAAVALPIFAFIFVIGIVISIFALIFKIIFAGPLFILMIIIALFYFFRR